MKLSNFTQGRNNNFNLIRIVAALAVLISHSFALASGSSRAEPFRDSLGMSLGIIAVNVFFITSGFLVTASLMNRQSVIEFAWARILRIFPALLVMLLLTVFGLGIYFTSLPVTSYLGSADVYIYFLKCATLITHVPFTLPGVFAHNPFRFMVNGSLWTLPFEIRMYVILAVVWLVLLAIIGNRLKLFKLVIICCLVISGVLVFIRKFHYPESENLAWIFSIDRDVMLFFFMFFSGSAFYCLQDHIRLSRSMFWLCLVALVSAAVIHKHAFFAVYTLTLSYVLIYVAYIPAGYIRKYNQAGDYSYGLYIYAFPVQQSLAALIPGISALTMILIASTISLVFAALSWHLIEQRALGLKDHFIGHTKRILAFNQTDSSTGIH